ALTALGALALAQAFDRPVAGAEAVPERLTSRPRPSLPVDKPVSVGAEIRTGTGERRRVVLPDGAVLYVNQNTTLKLDQARQLSLTTGEILVDSAAQKQADRPLVIKTPQREVAGKKAKFAVRIGEKGTGVIVTRGQVTVSGLDAPVGAGQQLAPTAHKS